MKYTTNLRLPYPEAADVPDGATQMQALAQRLDAAVPSTFAWSNIGAALDVPNATWVAGQLQMGSQSGGWAVDGSHALVVPQDGYYMASIKAYTNTENVRWAIALSIGAPESVNSSGKSRFLYCAVEAGNSLKKGDKLYLTAQAETHLSVWGADLYVWRLGDAPAPSAPAHVMHSPDMIGGDKPADY